MKKVLFLFIALTFTLLNVDAQGTGYWDLNGNNNADASNFIGTTGPQPLIFKTWGTERMQLHPEKAFLGIGVSIPRATLHLHNPQNNGQIPLLQLTTNGTGNAATNGFAVFSDYKSKDITFKQQEEAKFFIEGKEGGMVIAPTGKIGFGTDKPAEKMHLQGKLLIESNETMRSSLQFRYPLARGIEPLPSPSFTWDIFSDIDGLKFNTIKFDGTINQFAQRVVISNTGSVGIGVATPQAKLEVAGDIKAISADITKTLTTNDFTAQSATIAHLTGTTLADELKVDGLLCAKEVRVRLAGAPCWPDYVFSKNYNLMPLQELEQFVNENHHLPEIPSAATVEENGIELGQMNTLLLKKIEELTLYILDLQKQIDELKSR